MKKIYNATRHAILALNMETVSQDEEKTLDVVEFIGVVLACAIVVAAMSILPM